MFTHPMPKPQIIAHAKSLGFDLIGFTTPHLPPKYLTAFQNWLENKHEGTMTYMQKLDQRKDLNHILPGVKTVISLATNYYHEQPEEIPDDEGKVARYAYGRDYHKIIGKRLKKLETFIRELAPDHSTKSYVDTGPILERAYAEEASIGLIGKNSCLITEEYGSWVFLSEILTTLELEPDRRKYPPTKDFSACGGCRRCIDACPTGAIVAPGVIDSRRCISYLTIEHKDEIPKEFQKAIALTKRIYGCDICQEVCPHNQKKSKITVDEEFKSTPLAGNTLKKSEILALKTDEQFLKKFAGSPLMRAKRQGLQRNLQALD